MWVNSKEAAVILGVNSKSLIQAIYRAEKSAKKFCSIKCNILPFTRIDGRGGAAGKILQIWLDDEIVAAHRANLEGKEGFWGANTQISTNLNASLQGGERTRDSLNASEHPASFKKSSSTANFKGERQEFRSEISPKSITNNVITTNALSLNFITKEKNASGSDRKYPSSWSSKNDEAGASAIHSGKEDGNSSRTREYHAREFSDVKGGASAIHALCKENAGDGLYLEDNGSRNLRTQNKGSINGCTIYNLHDNHSISGDIIIDKKLNNQRSLDAQDRVEHGLCNNFVSHSGNYYEFNSDGIRVNCKSETIKTNEVADNSSKNAAYNTNGANLPLIATCSDKKRKAAFEKYDVVKEWEKAKGKISVCAFIEYINSKNVCSIKVTTNKLFDWQRKFKRGGLDALVDERTNNKTLTLEILGLKEYAIKLIHAQQGGINITNIYNLLNYEAIKIGKFSLEAFNGKKDECVSYEVVNRFVNNYLKENKLLKNIILYGEDGAVGRGLPALGRSNWAVDSINQIVEIDASPLDLICNASDICNQIGFNTVNNIFKDKDEFETYVKEWQKRYTIIALIDTYSGVATFHITDTENSVGIARAVAKYILRYGKPQVIKGDNGKAFKSEYINSVMNALEIEYRAVRAYSGWLKPYVERNFRALQHNFTANLAGFIGHNITQRQAIEFFYSKKERRLKKGYKTNLRELKNLSEVQELMDLYAEKFLNTRYLERLEMSVAEAYNEKAHEAVAMDAISLSARLGKRELKSVNKKGVSVGGIWYQNITMHGYNNVYANLNINNQSECFLWNEKGEFIDVAVAFSDRTGTSVEVAKASQKLFNKRLKETKEAKTIATNEVRNKFIDFVEKVEINGAVTPTVKAVNKEAQKIDADLKIARAAKSDAKVTALQIENAKSKAKETRRMSVFEEMALAKKKMA
ncbi:DDE-type integrase/transposase/recombinase [Campylobacter sp. RM12920]|uniref:DDE-type integrase/transposase/recombinase n=3 Tax=Campylobacter californiensis TaxID=1032243 RepID=A0ABD4JFG0_9BACT|nr:DDE-type integrase/transposase/recombinase [Campylobacter sp. RM12919]MBE2987443.1 DDE-type integrase/transposase/recombinase [Campylobacter sp. RM12920]